MGEGKREGESTVCVYLKTHSGSSLNVIMQKGHADALTHLNPTQTGTQLSSQKLSCKEIIYCMKTNTVQYKIKENKTTLD